MIQPQPPAGWTKVTQKEYFAASLKKARLTAVPYSSEVITVDDMMLQTGFFDFSGASELSELSRTPSVQQTPFSSTLDASFSSGSTTTALLDKKSTVNGPECVAGKQEDASKTLRDDAKENWRLIRKFLTGRQFYPPKRGHFSALLSTPRSRDIILRAGVRFVADQPKKVRILMAHMTGQESMPCNSCSLGRGPFKKCVAISKAAAGETTNGIVCCTNCATKKVLPYRCNVEVLLSRPAAVQQRKPREGPLVPKPRQQPSQGEAQVTRVDRQFTLTVHKLPVDGSIELDVKPESVRLCSVAVGKIMVDLESNPAFLLGTHGMFKLMPGTSAQVSNVSEGEAVLHISTLKT